MRRETIDPIGVSAIDLLVCAFIAIVVMNLLRQEDDPLPGNDKKGPEMFIIEADTACPLAYGLQIGDKQWWPGSKAFDITDLSDIQGGQASHKLIMRLPKNAGKVSLLVFAEPAHLQENDSWPVYLSHYGGQSAPKTRDTMTLERTHGFRLIYTLP